MIIEEMYKNCGTLLSLCKVWDSDNNFRIIEPYMIYMSSTGKRLFHCYQIEGYSRSHESAGWKNPPVNSFVKIEMIDKSFIQRREYNPFNFDMFPTVSFAIQTLDGKVRN